MWLSTSSVMVMPALTGVGIILRPGGIFRLQSSQIRTGNIVYARARMSMAQIQQISHIRILIRFLRISCKTRVRFDQNFLTGVLMMEPAVTQSYEFRAEIQQLLNILMHSLNT